MSNISSISKVRRNIEKCVGRQVQLKTCKGRKKSVTWDGVLENTYASIFTIKIEPDVDNQCERRATFSYADILMKTIELSVIVGDKRYYLS